MLKFIKKYTKIIIVVIGVLLIFHLFNQLLMRYYYGYYKCITRELIKEKIFQSKAIFITDETTRQPYFVLQAHNKCFVYKIHENDVRLQTSFPLKKDKRYSVLGISNSIMVFMIYPDNYYHDINKKIFKSYIATYSLKQNSFISKNEMNPCIDVRQDSASYTGNSHFAKFIDKDNIIINGYLLDQIDKLPKEIIALQYNITTKSIKQLYRYKGSNESILPFYKRLNGDAVVSFVIDYSEHPIIRCYSFKNKNIYDIPINDKYIKLNKISEFDFGNNSNQRAFIWLGDDRFVICAYLSRNFNKAAFKIYQIKRNSAQLITGRGIKDERPFFDKTISIWNNLALNTRLVLFIGGEASAPGRLTRYTHKCYLYDTYKNKIIVLNNFPYKISDLSLYKDPDNNIWIAGGNKIIHMPTFPFLAETPLNSIYKYIPGKKVKEILNE